MIKGLKIFAVFGVMFATSGCISNVGFSTGGFLEFPSKASAPEKDWAEGLLVRSSYTPPALPDHRVSYVKSGEETGQRVVLIHGSPGVSDHWAAVLPFIIPGLEFVAPDRPGFGFSTPLKPLPALADQAAALQPLLETPNGQKVILVGWSLGAPIAAQMAVDYPEQVAGVIIVAGAMDPDLEKVRFIQRIGDAPPFRYFLADNWRIANEELIPLEGELRELAPKLGQIRVPVTILHGSADNLVPVGNVDFMRRTLTGTNRLDVQILPGVDHEIPSRAPDIILDAITSMAGIPCDFETEVGPKRLDFTKVDCGALEIGTIFARK